MLPDNIFKNLPKNIKQEVFDSIVDDDHIKIERIVSRGHKTPESEWYDQEKNEWVIVLSGKARLLFNDGSSLTLETGDHTIIKAHTKHKVECTTEETETVWLAVHY